MGVEETTVGAAGDPLNCFDELLSACLRHLDKSVDRDTLEPILVMHLLVAACGAYEKTIRGAVDLRIGNSGDAEFVRYLGRVTEKHGIPFGAVSVDRFRKVMGTSNNAGMGLAKEVQEAYRRLFQNRHAVAHGGETDITLDELQCMHEMAKGVPLAFAAALNRLTQGG